jgi:hypothetical protein
MLGIAVFGPDATHTRSRGTVEMVVRMRTDPQFGPVLKLSTGGPGAEQSTEGGWRGLPLTDVDAMDMVAPLRKTFPAGVAGATPVDVAALLGLLHRVALLAEHVPEITELDLGPVVVGTLGAAVGAVRMRLADAAPVPDPFLRRLS